MILSIELPDEQAALLREKAEAQGLSLEDWFRMLAAQPWPKPRYQLSELIQQCDPAAPLSVQDQEWMEINPISREAL